MLVSFCSQYCRQAVPAVPLLASLEMFSVLVLLVVVSAFPALYLESTRTFLAMLLHVLDSWHLASTAKEPRTCEPVYRELALWEADDALVAFAIGSRTNV
ncbi:hypothetical protein BJ170DRAFT_291518 [Xylariales sp. AK1849]|nr:hypothetical protein BJ170DRAFT_291518 [Xylariales sp. AK1849]